MTCAGVMLACALLGSSMVTSWDAWPRGLHACPIFQQKTCTSGIQAHAHRLHARGSGRRWTNSMFDCCALPAAACECWPAEPQLMPQPPVVAKSCSNPRAHKQRCTTSEGLWLNLDLVGKWSHYPALPFLPQAQTSTILIDRKSVV